MMGRDPATVTYWEWQALLWNWNDRHSTGDKPAVEKPSAEMALKAMASEARRIAING